MEIVELSLRSSNQLVNDIQDQTINHSLFFDYHVYSPDVFQSRAEDLKKRSFQRRELSTYLREYTNRCLDHNEKTLENINRLEDPSSLVVIGGQQAGLLTGPLYTIHKIITIIKLAKEQEQKLGVPVIPVFWVAGEDHDFAEINHIFIKNNKMAKKLAINENPLKKQSVSEQPLNKQKTIEWIEQVFEALGETDYSNQLIGSMKECVERSKTYVEFFEKLILKLFGDTGLVLINSGDPDLKLIEKSCFRAIVDRNEEIYQAVQSQQIKMREHQYTPIIEMGNQSANFFFHHNGERFLFERRGNDAFHISEIGLTYSKAELIDLIETSPEKFSNNVVTRPLMQEYLFPTLAFIAGPGEVTYWAELKKVFSLFEMKMPPVLPRIQMTFLERAIERNIDETGIRIEEVLYEGVESAIERFLQKETPIDMNPLIEKAKLNIAEIHSSLVEAALEIDPSLKAVLKKNGEFIQDHLEFFTKTVDKRIRQKHDVMLSKFQAIELELLPSLHPQERIWNIYYYLNKFGPEFVGELLNLSYSFNGKHKIVKI
ncbi:bacillithiol biosynthesis cysteine-adding enzyme BshC [Metabacillus niabensis]|uniref:bacillithiol biosynthesis cysteine-adding enzyme BshC n=1 Tax=Metabacillus niabensis TaxID=324854 RepID=UPI001CFA6305|nr:bacillithiol biosynthesis cysteine-adding enzyme BshC [Metabacillus niabensis]